MGNPLTFTADGIVLSAQMVRAWGAKGRVYSLLAVVDADEQEWRYLSVRLAARYLGMHPRNVQRTLRELVAAGVLEVRPGAGSRAAGYRPDARVHRWAVEWAHAPDHVALLLAEAGVVVQVTPPQVPLVASSIGRRNGVLVASAIGRQAGSLVASNGERRGRLARGVTQMTPRAPSLLGAMPGPGLPSSGRSERERVDGADGELVPVSAEVAEARRRWVQAVTGAIYAKTNRPTLGRLLTRLERLAGELSFERARQAIDHAPDNLGPPMLVELLEQTARAGTLAPAPPPASSRRRWLVIWSDPDDPSAGSTTEVYDDQADAQAAAERLRSEGLDATDPH